MVKILNIKYNKLKKRSGIVSSLLGLKPFLQRFVETKRLFHAGNCEIEMNVSETTRKKYTTEKRKNTAFEYFYLALGLEVKLRKYFDHKKK